MDLMSSLWDSQSSVLLISGLGSVPRNGQCQINEVVLNLPEELVLGLSLLNNRGAPHHITFFFFNLQTLVIVLVFSYAIFKI